VPFIDSAVRQGDRVGGEVDLRLLCSHPAAPQDDLPAAILLRRKTTFLRCVFYSQG